MNTPRRPDPDVEAARRDVGMKLIPVDPDPEAEIAAFEVEVEHMGVIGRWAQTGPHKGLIIWTDGTHATTSCAPDRDSITAALRPSIPLRVEYQEHLKSKPSGTRTLPGLRRSA